MVASLLALGGAAYGSVATPGSLDKRFGDRGRLSVKVGQERIVVGGVARAPRRGSYVVANTEPRSAEIRDDGGRLLLLRVDRRGMPVRSFGKRGIARVSLSGGPASAHGVARQPDGKLVGVGSVGRDFADRAQDVLVSRFRPDGRLDPGFGSGGVQTADFAGISETASGVLVQPDGAIVVVGWVRDTRGGGPDTADDMLVVRYLPDGQLDPSFAAGGVLRVPAFSADGYLRPVAVARRADGALLIAGNGGTSRPGSNTPFVARIASNGSLDTSVGSSSQPGIVSVPTSTATVVTTVLRDMSFDPARGRLYLAGSTFREDTSDTVMYLAAVREQGLALDTGFGTNGVTYADFSGTPDDFATTISQDRRGRLVLAGGAASASDGPLGGPPTNGRFALARVIPNGTLDRRFGRRGLTRVGFGARQSIAHALVEQPRGRLLVAGITAGVSHTPPDSVGRALALTRALDR
jgi:uncharacterized delta-60 repeat protein